MLSLNSGCLLGSVESQETLESTIPLSRQGSTFAIPGPWAQAESQLTLQQNKVREKLGLLATQHHQETVADKHTYRLLGLKS